MKSAYKLKEVNKYADLSRFPSVVQFSFTQEVADITHHSFVQ